MLNIVGDINFADGSFDPGFGVGSLIKKGVDPFKHLLRDPRDIWIGNFEGVTSDKTNNKGYYKAQFITPPNYLNKINHLDFYNVANNHTMQHGKEAFENTLTNIKKIGSDYFGTKNKPSIEFHHKGKKISITSFSLRFDTFNSSPPYWYRPSYEEINNELSKIQNNDFKIVYIHWGYEFINRPNFEQKLLAHYLIDIGFDLIIGMHPHLLQGYEKYKGKYIYYSIGNFVFNMPWKPLQFGAIVKVDFDEHQLLISHEYLQIGKDFSPKIIDEKYVPNHYRFGYLNSILDKEENNEQYFAEAKSFLKCYRRSNYLYMIRNFLQLNYSLKTIQDIISDFLIRKFQPK